MYVIHFIWLMTYFYIKKVISPVRLVSHTNCICQMNNHTPSLWDKCCKKANLQGISQHPWCIISISKYNVYVYYMYLGSFCCWNIGPYCDIVWLNVSWLFCVILMSCCCFAILSLCLCCWCLWVSNRIVSLVEYQFALKCFWFPSLHHKQHWQRNIRYWNTQKIVYIIIHVHLLVHYVYILCCQPPSPGRCFRLQCFILIFNR